MIDVERLSAFFARQVEECSGPVAAELVLGGRSNLVFNITDGATSWILRRPPLGLVAPSANDVLREFRAVAAMAQTDVPVPRPVAFCEDPAVIGAPFSVVSKVDGQVIRTDADGKGLGSTAAGCGRALVDGLIALANVDPMQPGVRELGRPDGYLARQVERWRAQWDVVRTSEVDDLVRLHASLAANVPRTQRAGVVHGDYRIDNVLFAPGDPTVIAAVIDWEMATLGDPLADLGLFLVYWDPVCAPILSGTHPVAANPAFPHPDELIDRFRVGTDLRVDDLHFYVGLAAYKLAVIAEGIHRRYLDGDAVGEHFDRVGEAVRPLLAKGLAAVNEPSNRRRR